MFEYENLESVEMKLLEIASLAIDQQVTEVNELEDEIVTAMMIVVLVSDKGVNFHG